MDALKQWALCLIVSAAAGTFVMAVSPRGATDKTVRAVIGIFVVAAICSPLKDLSENDLSVNAFADYAAEKHDEAELNGYMLDSFGRKVKKSVLSVAAKHGIKINDIYIDAYIDANNCIIIHEITVAPVQGNNEELYDDFSAELCAMFGIAVTVNAE